MKMIEAQKVVPLIRLILFDNPNIEKICKGMQDVVNIHTIEAEPIRWGHWIDGADSFGAKRGKYRVCSFCNICIPRTKEVPDAYWQCCPNCMTKMKK